MRDGYTFVLGCDEAGVGPLAGPVVAAACLLNPRSIGKYRSKNKWYARLRDSKTVSDKEREEILKEILSHAIAWGVGEVWQEDIDKLNIHQASLKAMKGAVENLLSSFPEPLANILILVDGRFIIPELKPWGQTLDQKCVVAGDAQILSIAAASIIAKVHRDHIMRKLDADFPGYGFAHHKGYGTPLHQEAIRKFGVLPVHRRSFLKNLKNMKIA